MATAEEIDQRLRDFQREYIDFLDDGDQQGIYSSLVRYTALLSGIQQSCQVNSSLVRYTRVLSGIQHSSQSRWITNYLFLYHFFYFYPLPYF